MANKITFKEFNALLKKENFYSDREIRHLFNAIRQTDKETRKWIIDWFFTGEYPTKVVEQITVRELIDEFGFKPINAFITIDWLKHDPEAAKYFIMQAPLIGKDIVISADETADSEKAEEYNGIGLDTRTDSDEIE